MRHLNIDRNSDLYEEMRNLGQASDNYETDEFDQPLERNESKRKAPVVEVTQKPPMPSQEQKKDIRDSMFFMLEESRIEETRLVRRNAYLMESMLPFLRCFSCIVLSLMTGAGVRAGQGGERPPAGRGAGRGPLPPAEDERPQAEDRVHRVPAGAVRKELGNGPRVHEHAQKPARYNGRAKSDENRQKR